MQSLYVIQCGDFFKIGIAGDVLRRLLDLQVANPHTLKLVYSTPKIKEASRIENHWHRHFNQCRTSGEWFALKHVDILQIIAETPRMAGFRADFAASDMKSVPKNILPRLKHLSENRLEDIITSCEDLLRIHAPEKLADP